MGIRFDWDNPEQTAIRIQGEGQWTWAEFRAATGEIAALIDAHGHRVGIIVDHTGTGYMPQGNMLTHFQDTMRQLGNRVTIWTIVSPNTFARTIINILLQLQRNKAHHVLFVASLDEARTRVAELVE